jgi:hypothetical protein
MLNILGMIILIIILFIILLLLFGIRISLEYIKNGGEIKGCIKILVFKKIRIYTSHFPSDDEEEEEEEEEHESYDVKKIFNLAKPCLEDLLNYFRTVIGTLKISRIENHIIFGMESFADTGKYIGIIWAILAMINSLDRNLKISAEPSFTGARLDGRGVNELEIYPLKFLPATLRLLSKKEVRLLIRGVLDER